ncbi:MAG TPA: hypothetical protein VH061_09380 [Solirubrobacteraceae bacterium]|jgi:hypothetical protein|nr:hypothetical protein [Solirubrobacteraceae bacterium]
MAGAPYVDDVVALVEALAVADLAPSVLPFVPDTDDPGWVVIDAYVGADDVRPALAVQQLIQLCVDSAAILVGSWDRLDPHLSREEVEAILRDRPVELTIVYLSDGSFFAKYSINPKTPEGRKRIVAMGGVAVAALVLTAVLPPVAITVAGVLPAAAAMLKPDPEKSKGSPTAAEAKVDLKTVDREDLAGANVHVTVTGPTHVYDIHVEGPQEAKDAFLAHVLTIEGVQQSSRFVEPGGDAGRPLRVWSSRALNGDQIRVIAAETGVGIAGVVHTLTPG